MAAEMVTGLVSPRPCKLLRQTRHPESHLQQQDQKQLQQQQCQPQQQQPWKQQQQEQQQHEPQGQQPEIRMPEDLEAEWRPHWEEWKKQVQQEQQHRQQQQKKQDNHQWHQQSQQEQKHLKQQHHLQEGQRQKFPLLDEAARAETTGLTFDVHEWLKYGEKFVRGCRQIVRCYFRCKQSKLPCSNPCPAKKQVVFDFRTGNTAHTIEYLNQHNHSPSPSFFTQWHIKSGHSRHRISARMGSACRMSLPTAESADGGQAPLTNRVTAARGVPQPEPTSRRSPYAHQEGASLHHESLIFSQTQDGSHDGQKAKELERVEPPVSPDNAFDLRDHPLQEITLPTLAWVYLQAASIAEDSTMEHSRAGWKNREQETGRKENRQGLKLPDLRLDQQKHKRKQQQQLQLDHEATTLLRQQLQQQKTSEKQKQQQQPQQQQQLQHQNQQLKLLLLLMLHEEQRTSLLEIEKQVLVTLQEQHFFSHKPANSHRAHDCESWIASLEQQPAEKGADRGTPADVPQAKLLMQMAMDLASDVLTVAPPQVDMPAVSFEEITNLSVRMYQGINGHLATNAGSEPESHSKFLQFCHTLAGLGPPTHSMTKSAARESAGTLEAVVLQALHQDPHAAGQSFLPNSSM